MEADTMSLRKAAPQWSLAGDKQLLGMLEKIHQTIVSKCQDANSKLDAMVDALDNASVDLQNVNNKFMALSNCQFVESRVYDDDVDVAVKDVKKQDQPQVPTNEDKAEIIRKALEKLEIMHEPVEILDSDSSDDEESSMILKPKDIYSHRPLPYIIGSFAWKSKWHAGLLREESDSDTSISKEEEAEEYSESEPETPDVQPHTNQRTISSSSSLQSDISKEPQLLQQRPADVAAEITRRLGGPPLQVPTALTVPIEVPEPSRTVYRVEKPAPATIFPDEPPPLDTIESEYSDDDIFAELHKKTETDRQNHKKEYRSDIMKDLFGNALVDGIEPHTPLEVQPNASSTQRESSPALDNNIESKTNATVKETPDTDVSSKKPVGGISLFSTNKGAESIGAAILKRNQRKMSTSEESDVTEQKEPESEQKSQQPDSKKIIEDLFVKPAKKVDKDIRVKLPNINVIRKEPKEEQKAAKPTDKIDLFSDNLFDDIDDIFTTNVVTKPKIDKNTKSIFDDDDLFSEISIEKPEKSIKKDTKSIFDDDDDLFTENDKTPKTSSSVMKNSLEKTVKTSEEIKKVKSIFDDDSEDDLFSDIKITKTDPKVTNHTKETNSNLNISSKTINSEKSEKININENNDLLFKNHEREVNVLNVSTDKKSESKQFQSPSLFDDEDDELFNTTTQNNELPTKCDDTEKLLYSEDKSNKITNEIKINKDIEDNVKNENIFNEPSRLGTRCVPSDESSESNIFDRESTGVNNENIDFNTERNNIENERQPKEAIVQDDVLKDELASEIFTDDNKAENNPKSEVKSDDDPFSDIFTDLPPEFEKPSEPKKSKNVNALFDDDSDDESLFFKKDDVISDEKPDLNFDSDRFRIFHDEPPDIDVDFSQKPLKVSNEKSNIFNTDKDISEDRNEDKPVEYILPQKLDDTSDISNITVQSNDKAKILEDSKNPAVDISKLLEENNDIDIIKSKDSQENSETNKKDSQTNEEIIDSSEENETKKPVGKLKPMNFNINVNTLLPGASPKKAKVNEETDGQSTSTQSNEELSVQSPTKDVTVAKSVSFDEDQDSGILDNKLSKQRAKIQVKRRPSTRRARLEAVRKSRIDLEYDSTDNSSSFDEPRKVESDEIKQIKTEEPRTTVFDEIDSKLEKDNNKEETISSTNVDNIDIAPKIEQNILKKPEVKSKIVYILNDEDIFSTPAANIQNPKQNVLSIVDDDDDDELFKTSNTKIKPREEKKNKVQSNNDLKSKPDLTNKNLNTNKNKARNSIFGDSDDDEELFGKKKINKEKKVNIFDSDSDEDAKLFTNKKKMETKEITQGPLFGDESDDDELFGAKTKNTERQTSKREMKKSTQEVVFDHPLSLKGNER